VFYDTIRAMLISLANKSKPGRGGFATYCFANKAAHLYYKKLGAS